MHFRINSPPLSIEQLHGKVVLIDFWTYSCINCIRTLPYLKKWYDDYRKDGLVIIGVHTPEFEFEKKPENVKEAVKRFGIQYPVVLDNDYKIWNNFKNHYWPAHFLIDKNGFVVYEHFGEGSYDETEQNIRILLGLSEMQTTTEPTSSASFMQSPETYLGYARASNFQSAESLEQDKATEYHYSTFLSKDGWALQGLWEVQAERIISKAPNASLKFNFYARNIYIVMGSNDGKPKQVTVTLNGSPIEKWAGKDLVNSTVTVTDNRLYEIIELNDAEAGMLELISKDPGLLLYTFTFGS